LLSAVALVGLTFWCFVAGTSSKAVSHRRRKRWIRAGVSTEENEDDADSEQPEKRPLKAAKQTFEGAVDPTLLVRSIFDDAKGTLLRQPVQKPAVFTPQSVRKPVVVGVQPQTVVSGVFSAQAVPAVKTLMLDPSSVRVARPLGSSSSASSSSASGTPTRRPTGTPTASVELMQWKPKSGPPSIGSGTPTASLQTTLPNSPWPALASRTSSRTDSLSGPGSS